MALKWQQFVNNDGRNNSDDESGSNHVHDEEKEGRRD
jgi:hypothetical protein